MTDQTLHIQSVVQVFHVFHANSTAHFVIVLLHRVQHFLIVKIQRQNCVITIYRLLDVFLQSSMHGFDVRVKLYKLAAFTDDETKSIPEQLHLFAVFRYVYGNVASLVEVCYAEHLFRQHVEHELVNKSIGLRLVQFGKISVESNGRLVVRFRHGQPTAMRVSHDHTHVTILQIRLRLAKAQVASLVAETNHGRCTARLTLLGIFSNDRSNTVRLEQRIGDLQYRHWHVFVTTNIVAQEPVNILPIESGFVLWNMGNHLQRHGLFVRLYPCNRCKLHYCCAEDLNAEIIIIYFCGFFWVCGLFSIIIFLTYIVFRDMAVVDRWCTIRPSKAASLEQNSQLTWSSCGSDGFDFFCFEFTIATIEDAEAERTVRKLNQAEGMKLELDQIRKEVVSNDKSNCSRMNQGKKSERELKKTSGQMMPNEEEELLCTTNWRVKTVEALALEKSQSVGKLVKIGQKAGNYPLLKSDNTCPILIDLIYRGTNFSNIPSSPLKRDEKVEKIKMMDILMEDVFLMSTYKCYAQFLFIEEELFFDQQ
ncbi:hypothetical protein T4C_11684 [Trichinella pseudospiralis]|uniref:Uncharacterized protein n=1 Tax=Trichinella pseudospiralis TaxID=6337 RepID=A0A0V1K4I2_TRIPS|nr:hypothetical protein T4C_11684 [Trichinella pseudospiralis]